MKLATLLLLALIITTGAYATDTLSKKYPTALLVQLPSEHNRVQAAKKEKRFKELAEMQTDGEAVRKRLILDFQDHFDYCPVYYYIDTNADFIKNKEFRGVLLNADETPVASPAKGVGSGDYVIAYYGYAVSQPKGSKVQGDTSVYTYDPQPPAGKGLVILNSKFQQLTYFYRLGYDDLFNGKKSDAKKYSYSSKHFDIDYHPFAGTFNKKLLERGGGHRVE